MYPYPYILDSIRTWIVFCCSRCCQQNIYKWLPWHWFTAHCSSDDDKKRAFCMKNNIFMHLLDFIHFFLLDYNAWTLMIIPIHNILINFSIRFLGQVSEWWVVFENAHLHICLNLSSLLFYQHWLGLLRGNTYELGDFDECLKINVPNQFEPRYW